MSQETKININAIDCNFSVTACSNGFMVEMNGKDPQGEWRTVKHLTSSIDGLFDVIRSMNDRFDITR